MASDPHQIFSRKNNERIKELIATILECDVNDPRLEFVTVTSVDTAPDTRSARVYVSADPASYANVLAGLESARGRLQRLLGHALGWKYTPELRFAIDESIDQAAVVDAVLAEKRAVRSRL
ncbi:MAG: 30S ribosome-binding factor RbfA [Actinomycetia bacterium]|nr:30S ribosome-binding factor RbfA [Actinomycetes bacterium]